MGTSTGNCATAVPLSRRAPAVPGSLEEPPGPRDRSRREPLASHYPGHARPRPTVTQEVSMRKDRPHVPSAAWRMEVACGNKPDRHYKSPRAPAGSRRHREAAREGQLRWEVQETRSPSHPALLLPAGPRLPATGSWALCPRELIRSWDPLGALQRPRSSREERRGCAEPTQGPGARHDLSTLGVGARGPWLFGERPLAFPQKSQTATCWGTGTCPQPCQHRAGSGPPLHKSFLVPGPGSSRNWQPKPRSWAVMGRQHVLAGRGVAPAELAAH